MKGWFRLKVNITKEKIKECFKGFKSELDDIKLNGYSIFINKRIGAIVILVLIVGIAFVMMFSNGNKDVYNQFYKGLKTHNAKILSKCLRVENEKVSSEELVPLINYYKDSGKDIDSLIKELNKNGESNIFTVEKKKKIFGEEYYINVNRVNGEVTSNIKETKFTIGDKTVMNGEEVSGIIPGLYTVKYFLKTEYGDISGEKNIEMVNNANVFVEVDAKYITLNSAYTDGNVFINNRDVGIKVEDVKNYGPIPADGKVVLYIEKDFPWGSIKSDDVVIRDESFITININMVNDSLMGMMDSVVSDFYKSVFEALNSRDKSLILNTTEEVTTKVYDYINEKSFLLKNNYEISDLEVKIEKSDFKYIGGEYKASVVTNINYSVYKKLLPFAKKEYSQMFIVALEYLEDRWTIKDIQKLEME